MNRVDYERPSKRDVFLFMACVNSLLSPDSQTQCGCIITTKDNKILGTGYNGFPRGVNNKRLPNLRPDKYIWVNSNHSERNAVNNCIVNPRTVGGGIAYVTGNCCADCTTHLWNNGVNLIYEVQGFNAPVMHTSKDEEQKVSLMWEIECGDGQDRLHIYKVGKDCVNKLWYELEEFEVKAKLEPMHPLIFPPLKAIFHHKQINQLFDLFLADGIDYEALSLSYLDSPVLTEIGKENMAKKLGVVV